MRVVTFAIVLFVPFLAACAPASGPPEPTVNIDEDPYLWLEEVESDRAIRWVRARNRATVRKWAQRSSFKKLRERLLAVFDSQDRIPTISKMGEHYYNFWRDTDQPRGIWRRTTLDEYRLPSPNWQTVLDLDAVARKEKENWVLGGLACRQPDYGRCLISLSRGGADAEVTREFDIESRSFVEDGFKLPESKGTVAWAGPDSLFVATDFGPGTMTESGYPRIVKLWRRGQDLADAETVFEGRPTDVSVSASADLAAGFETELVWRATDFYHNDLYLRRDGQLIPIAKPSDASAYVHRGQLFIELKADWLIDDTSYAAGSLLTSELDAFLAGERKLERLFEPTPQSSLAGFAPTRNHVLVNVLDNVRNRVYVATPGTDGWTQRPLFASDGFRTVSVSPVDPDHNDAYFASTTDYLTPPSLLLGSIGGERAGTQPGPEEPEVLKQQPGYFDADGLAITQHWAVSADGTRIPYFQVGRNEATDGPTLLYGYGGFEIPLVPGYSAGVGLAWLERGGVYVVANIRGGGEFGPNWHRAALKANRQRAYDDFVAVAEDLIERGVTERSRLGIQGGSNGGLLMGNMLTMRPDLFGAIVAQVPLLDMRRYHELLAGASWVAEYGDPDDPEQWSYLKNYSPYQNVHEDTAYPPLLITTSTRDDRVHPGHARKMVAKMRAYGHDVTYYENIEGGHGGAADNAQSAFMWALVYEFLWRKLTER